jgi:glycosyltransferase involved in cell wall biosynthesis
MEAILVIVGSGSEKYKIKNLAFELGLSNKIEFFDWTDDVYTWYMTADAYVLSSNYEGWGMVIIEAASCGLPIIMTDVGCAGEVIKAGENGVIVPIGDEEKFSDAMARIIEDENFRKKVAANAHLVLSTLPTKKETLSLYRNSWELALK